MEPTPETPALPDVTELPGMNRTAGAVTLDYMADDDIRGVPRFSDASVWG